MESIFISVLIEFCWRFYSIDGHCMLDMNINLCWWWIWKSDILFVLKCFPIFKNSSEKSMEISISKNMIMKCLNSFEILSKAQQVITIILDYLSMLINQVPINHLQKNFSLPVDISFSINLIYEWWWKLPNHRQTFSCHSNKYFANSNK